jgi:predicted nucleotide-binding protein
MAQRPREADQGYLTVPLDDGHRWLEEQIKEAEDFLRRLPVTPSEVISWREGWANHTYALLKDLFTNDGPANDFDKAKDLSFTTSAVGRHDHARSQVRQQMDVLRSLQRRLEFYVSSGRVAEPAATGVQAADSGEDNRRDVFIVHGHDEGVKQGVARFLEKLGINPIILHELADRGRTIIQKFEDHADVRFAVVLLTPDDEGRARGASDLRERARQNVILELGYFIGRLGRSNVCALKTEGVEEPSDLRGVLYTPLDSANAWHMRLAKELKAAGFDIDRNKAI